jgi:hypothetical protein
MEASVNLDLVAGQTQGPLLQSPVRKPFARTLPWNIAAFLALWEIQSQLATIAYVGLVAFTSWYVTLGAMLVWSLTATLLFWHARERGYPNILNSVKCPRSEAGIKVAWHAVTSVFSAVLGGIHAFVYTRCANSLLNEQPAGRPRRFLRRLVLVVGMTMFGVTVAEQLLRSAGYSGRRLLQLASLGPFLNVPYRVVLSAVFVALLNSTLGLFPHLSV